MNRLFYEGLTPGMTLFGKYQVRECLGASSISAVYLCTDPEDRLVVLKVANAADRIQTQSRDMLEREIAFAKRVKHRNVLSPLERYEDDEFVAFAMEYHANGTLADLIKKHIGIAPLALGLKIIKELAEGIAALHAQGISHRDIKPDNILMSFSDTPRIADFGLASYHHEHASAFNGCIVGTPDYLSPEYVLNGTLDEKSDIYAFGVVAYEILTGRLPYEGSDIYDTLSQRIKVDAIAPSVWNHKIPGGLNNLIQKSLSRDPLMRPTAAEIVRFFKPASEPETFFVGKTRTRNHWFPLFS